MNYPSTLTTSEPTPIRNRAAIVDGAAVAVVVMNLVGVAWYLWAASHAWAIPAERAAGIYSVTGEPFIWAMFVFPVWATFVVLNGVWIGIARIRRRRLRLAPILIMVVLWASALVLDFAHH